MTLPIRHYINLVETAITGDLRTMTVMEIFNSATTSDWATGQYPWNYNEDDAEAVLVKGKVFTTFSDGDTQYEVNFLSRGGQWGNNKGGMWVVEFHPTNATGEGDFYTELLNRGKSSVLVFSKVIGLVKEFTNRHEPDVLVIGAREPKRQALYDRIAKRFESYAKQSGYTRIDHNGTIYFATKYGCGSLTWR